MDVHELAGKINKILCSEVKGNEEEWLALGKELENFVRDASPEEVMTLRQECPGGEMFCIVFWGIKHERQTRNKKLND